MWAKYGYLSPEELEILKTCEDEKTYYIRDFVQCDSHIPYKYDSTAKVELRSSHPCLALFWKAVNIKAEKYNNRSNYTTNPDNIKIGTDPIFTTSLSYDTVDKFANLPSHHFSIASARTSFSSAPEYKGYHALSFADDSLTNDVEVGIVFNAMKTTLECKFLKNNDDDSDPLEDKFKLVVRLLVMKQLIIKDGKFILK
jgi:hypothetical protein